MFGYVKPYKPELKIKDYEVFKAYYCGLCRSIKETFGNIPRLSLNYDMTFMAILLDGLNSEPGNFYIDTCLVHPLKKRMILTSNYPLIYSAYLNVALTYYKLCDDVIDDGEIKSSISKLLLKGYRDKFSKEYSHIDEIIKENLKALSTFEKSKNVPSLDELCHPFALLTAKVICYYKEDITEEVRKNLYTLGYNLGKWIYLMDALDDLQEDMENKKFNPIDAVFNKSALPFQELYDQIKDRLEFSILCCSNSLLDAFNELDFFKNKEIIENILKLGLMDRYIQIENKYNSSASIKLNEV